MKVPFVSVLMPVYNAERFLKQAVDSILGQSFTDLELVVVDDGSTDNSAAIIAGYDDTRLVAVTHEANQGVIAARNTAVLNARGNYIAIMDSDDISHPERLARQVEYLEHNPECGVVATRVALINEDGKPAGCWRDDAVMETAEQIRNFLPVANCIANSSVMLRAHLLREYGYSCPTGVTEDYDLWLRLASDGVQIAKLKDQLVSYRVTPGSLTARIRNHPPEYQQVRNKWHFLSGALRRGAWGAFSRKVAGSLLRDIVRLVVKKMFHLALGAWPDDNRDRLALQLNQTLPVRLVVKLTALLGALIPIKNRSGLFFFFPFFHVGGAERVHADIVSCFHREKPWVVFTKKSASKEFYPLFNRGARLLNLWPICKYLYPFSVGLAAGFINRHTQPQVFGANSLFYALLIPFLKPHVRCGDLIHAFGGGVETFTLPVASRLDRRVVINRQTGRDLTDQYAEAGLNADLAERVILIPNRVNVAPKQPSKQWDGPLQVLYVGRFSEEKRVHLVGKAAKRCRLSGLQVTFTLVGDSANSLASDVAEYCNVAGHVGDMAQLAELYARSHMIVITSSREGFPLTVMEGMAQGCVPVCTAVGGIPEHIEHGENGWLLPTESEEAVVAALCTALERLSHDRVLLARLSAASWRTAAERFCGQSFCERYRRVIVG